MRVCVCGCVCLSESLEAIFGLELIWSLSFVHESGARMGYGWDESGDDWCAGAADCTYATGFNIPYGVALDPSSGALYVVNYGISSVCRVPPGGNAVGGSHIVYLHA